MTGKMPCVVCGAIGYMQDGKLCPVCKGKGYITTITCPHCEEEIPDTAEDLAQHEFDCGSECGLTDDDLEIG
jgi:hypothetical protein